jgi:L-malate glycosyltransferase
MTLSILMFCSQFRPLVGGAERQAEKLSQELVRRGLAVRVLTPWVVEESAEEEEASGVMIYRFPMVDLNKRFPGVRGLGPLNLLSIRAQTLRAVSKHLEWANVVHAHIASPLTAFAMQAAKQKGIPILCKVATAGERTDFTETSAIGIGGKRLARAMVAGMDRWVATTEAVRKSLVRSGVSPHKIVSIPNGVELVDHPTALFSDGTVAKRFLYLGRLSRNSQRDVPTVIRAFDRVADQVLDAQLDLVGYGDLLQETTSLVARTRNRHRICVHGLQEPGPWLALADCLVLPSRREGLSNALLEAMANGLACIANDIPPNREVLDGGKVGVLVDVGDENRLYNELLLMAREPGRARSYGEKARQRAEAVYSISEVARRYHELYGQLAKQV